MPITGPASYIPTNNEVLAHWAQGNAARPPGTPLLVRLPDSNTTVARAQFVTLPDAVLFGDWRPGVCLNFELAPRSPPPKPPGTRNRRAAAQKNPEPGPSRPPITADTAAARRSKDFPRR